MIKHLLPVLLVLPVPALAEKAPAPASEEPKILVSVDGTPINQLHYLFYRSQQGKGRDLQDRNVQLTMLNELISTTMVANEARARKLDQHPEIQAAIELSTRSILAEAAAQDHLKQHPVTDAAISKAYADEYLAGDTTEYRARHILLKSEEDAKAVIKSLDGGADFATLAKEKSTGPSGPNGGDLGWFSPDVMVKPFADATMSMKKGGYSKTPVQTQFGWHVILLEDSRTAERPKFEEVKDDLRRDLQRQAISNYLNDLRQKAKVEFQEPADKPATGK